jgi:hypothetical protein
VPIPDPGLAVCRNPQLGGHFDTVERLRDSHGPYRFVQTVEFALTSHEPLKPRQRLNSALLRNGPHLASDQPVLVDFQLKRELIS